MCVCAMKLRYHLKSLFVSIETFHALKFRGLERTPVQCRTESWENETHEVKSVNQVNILSLFRTALIR